MKLSYAGLSLLHGGCQPALVAAFACASDRMSQKPREKKAWAEAGC